MRSSTVIFILYALAVINVPQANAQVDCGSQETCTACIRSPNCSWCGATVDRYKSKSLPRCINLRNIKPEERENWCDAGKISSPKSDVKVIRNDSFSSPKSSETIQIQPQIMKLKLRRGEERRFVLRYKQAQDYPVDLYFVADLSGSMGAFWQQLGDLSGQIVGSMKRLTKNFRLGFGSFIDKDFRPMDPDNYKWDGYGMYAFRNHMPLTNETSRFQELVRNSKTGGSFDAPEGGFDAIMQAIVCKEEIDWRSDARHLLVHASDYSPHIAGDGRFLGLPQPNEEKCHLSESGYFTHANQQDYPSIGQIKWQASENNINIIFAATYGSRKTYEEVHRAIPGSSVGLFEGRSQNIAQLIESHYKELVKSIAMKSNSTSNLLSIKYFSRCLSNSGELQETNSCHGIRVNDIVEFEIVIKALDCPGEGEDRHHTIEIKPEKINERVIVDVEMMCDCECSKSSDQKRKEIPVAECNRHGVLDCGICSCNKGYLGKTCECKGDQTSTGDDKLMDNCRFDNTSQICSGRGSCTCGTCNCEKLAQYDEHFYGKFCQCDDMSCIYSADGKLCGGNGKCECGECRCHAGWGGSACECKDDVSLCRPPGQGAKTCSEAGKCECGLCKCNAGRNGRYCEDCPSCPSQRCDELKDCVECLVHKSGTIYAEDSSCLKCLDDGVEKVDGIDENPEKTKDGEHICRVAGDDGSTFVFKYVYVDGESNDRPKIYAAKDKEFPIIGDFLAATIGAVLATLLLGFLIIMIWKILTHLHDKKEYEKFIKESSQANFGMGQNPLYKDATSVFQNPTFDSESQSLDSAG